MKKENRIARPLFDFDADVSVRRSFSISEKAANLVDAYADFHTDLARVAGGPATKSVSAGDVVEKLILGFLSKDKAFAEWQREKCQSGDVSVAIRSGKVNAEALASAAATAPKPTLKAAALPPTQTAK